MYQHLAGRGHLAGFAPTTGPPDRTPLFQVQVLVLIKILHDWLGCFDHFDHRMLEHAATPTTTTGTTNDEAAKARIATPFEKTRRVKRTTGGRRFSPPRLTTA